MGKAYENALEMPRFARVTMLIIKAHHPASPIGVFCCFFPPTILLTLPPNGFSEFRGEHFVSHSEDIWDMANTSLLRRKPCHLCSLPQDGWESAWMFLKQTWMYLLQALWPKE